MNGFPAPGGRLLENRILSDLLVWSDSRPGLAEPSLWRTHSRQEVDFDIGAGENRGQTTGRPRLSDARHLLTFQEEHGGRSRAALLLAGPTPGFHITCRTRAGMTICYKI